MNYEHLEKAITLIWNTYKDEIIESGDWWFNLDEHTLNFHDLEDRGIMTVSVYHASNNQTNYDDPFDFSMEFKYDTVWQAYDGTCPDCGEDIPEDVKSGQECLNCGHVFYRYREVV